ncbi:hypothetical protein [Polyangium spumosum]|uniref:hypothetical protein n=1 Tax=Polyangium spumosum TaxID=889282 RepID=UPI001478E2FE|nr:hypothetical protein [Polyangium spumosum]
MAQVIAFAGSGKLTDDGETSKEFREFLNHVPSDVLVRYAEDCLKDPFPDSGLALQDIINQVGRRLGFDVLDGKYRGQKGQPGQDGIWRLRDGHAIVVEVKTTDAYRIDLGVLAGYRNSLVAAGIVAADRSSNLIVVGRQDTGDLEAQIRGSRHAWDIRLISVDSLMRLMRLKETVEAPQTVSRIHAILVPKEFTRIDAIVDIVFSAAEEVKQAEPDPGEAPLNGPAERPEEGPKFTPVSFHDACAARLEQQLKTTLVRQTRASYASPDDKIRLTCSISKKHHFAGDEAYWFAFHPYYLEFLTQTKRAYVAFGCGSEQQIFLVPLDDFRPWLEGSYTTEKEGRLYWHVQIYRDGSKWWLKRRQGVGDIEVTKFLLTPRAANQR